MDADSIALAGETTSLRSLSTILLELMLKQRINHRTVRTCQSFGEQQAVTRACGRSAQND